MSLRTISRWLLAIGCVGALPLYAQTAATTTSTTTTKTETHVTHKAKTEATETKAEEKKETKAEEKTEHKTVRHAKRTVVPMHLVDDAARLAAILNDSQTNITVSPAVWKVTAGEANTLANRVYAAARTSAEKKAAREARTHVREMHAAATKGDDAAAKSHAGMALPYVYQVIDAATK